MNVCQRNVARFGHVECRFDKIHEGTQVVKTGSFTSRREQSDKALVGCHLSSFEMSGICCC